MPERKRFFQLRSSLNLVFAELWLIRMVMDLALFAFYLVVDVDDAVKLLYQSIIIESLLLP